MRTYDELSEELHERAAALPDRVQFWLGIAGGPGSGKSTLAAALQARLGQVLTVIPLDGYHYLRNQLDKMEDPVEAHLRRGAPFTFNSTRFVNDLVKAKKSGEGSFPGFDHRAGDPIENEIQLTPTDKIVLVEGNYLLLNANPWRRLQEDVFDEKWFLDVSVQESNRRVAKRHMKMGLSEAQAWQRVMTNDGINAELIAQESPGNADRIITVGPGLETMTQNEQA